jgi:hypothetical protein
MKKIIITLTAFIPAFVLIFSLLSSGVASASFNKNNLISDPVFSNKNAMTASQINSFLNKFAQSCISTNSGFLAIDPVGYAPDTGFKYGGYVSAGAVIYHSAQAYDLNPRVLLATLEKEQSLVTGRNNYTGYCANGDEHKYASAMGYGCPDSGTTHSYTGVSLYKRNGVVHSITGTTCVNSKSKAGFTQQVIRAAWLLKFGQQRSLGNVDWAVIKGDWDNSDDPDSCYSGPMTKGTFQRGPSYCGGGFFDGYTTIDSQSVYMSTGATATLYWYTPHIHGNQIFVSLFEGWFGSTQTNPVKITVLDSHTNESGGTAIVRFTLLAQPSDNVTLPVTSSDTTEGTLSANQVVFTPSDWNTPTSNQITITGINDTLTDGDIGYLLTTGDPASTDPGYGGLDGSDVGNVRVYNDDNESDIAVPGDWDRDGRDEIGLKRGDTFFLNYGNDGSTDVKFRYGAWDDVALSGDWDGDGRDEIGIKRGNTYFLNYENNGDTEIAFMYGEATDTPLVGDWDRDGRDEIGLKRGNTYFLNYGNDGKTEVTFNYGDASYTPLTGDWDGDGRDEIGLKAGNTYYLNYDNDGRSNVMFKYGDASYIPLTGNWDGDGRDEIGLKAGNTYYLNYENDGRSNVMFKFGR